MERNRVKRLLREAFERARPEIGEGYDVVVVARPAASELAQRQGLAGIEGALDELLRKSAQGPEHVTGAPTDVGAEVR